MTTSASRQARFRERHREQAGDRINHPVSAHTAAALRRLAIAQRLTRRAMLEKVLAEAESAFVDQLPHEDQQLYYTGVPVHGGDDDISALLA
jgi:hypothetical protein